MRNITIGTRGSDLALWQAQHVQAELNGMGIHATIKIIVTKGDITHHLSFDKIEGKGFFTKELEEELLCEGIDLAVHSYKDLPTQSPEGLTIAAFSAREQPTDALIIRPESLKKGEILALKPHAVIGTSSARRKMQVRALRPDAIIEDLRGNVPTRINKLRSGKYDAILLASAGLIRLNLDLTGLEVIHLSPTWFVPAASQGVLALQTRSNDEELIIALQKLQDHKNKAATEAERTLLHHFGGGCHMPLAIHALLNDEGELNLRIAHSDDPHHFPKRLHWPSFQSNLTQLPALPPLIKAWQPQPFFISRTEEQAPFFKRHADQFNLNSSFTSLSDTQPVQFHIDNFDYEVLIFNSERAVRYFFRQTDCTNFRNCMIISSGDATTRSLERLGLEVTYTCKKSDFTEVSGQLLALVQHKKCLVPCSAHSARTLALPLSKVAELTELVIYEPVSKSIKVQEVDWYVFTSPAQVQAFASMNNFRNEAHYFCLGPTTEASLKAFGVRNCYVSEEPTELSLLELLNTTQFNDYKRKVC